MVDNNDVNIGWPRVNVACEYLKPIRFEDEFEIQLIVSDVTDKTIKYEFNFFDDDNRLLAKGSVVVVCVKFIDSGMKSTAIPDLIRNSITNAAEQS
jgi:acyl-CoA thioesterase FadM|tara:strand:+ start:167 stop:454 length:288 start_codon:yes stop_codon:yes gene_type:complete